MQLPAVLVVFFCLLPGLTNSEVFSSVADMQVETLSSADICPVLSYKM